MTADGGITRRRLLGVAIAWAAAMSTLMVTLGVVHGFDLAALLIGLPSVGVAGIGSLLLGRRAVGALARSGAVAVSGLCAAAAMVSFVVPLLAVVPTSVLIIAAAVVDAGARRVTAG